jgi:hypothetical protein
MDPTTAGAELLDALDAADVDRIAACLAPEVTMRALVPDGLKIFEDREAVVGILAKWFVDEPVMTEIAWRMVEDIGPRLRIGYRVLWDDANGVRWVFEQHAYVEVGPSGIGSIDLVCTGDHEVAAEPEVSAR